MLHFTGIIQRFMLILFWRLEGRFIQTVLFSPQTTKKMFVEVNNSLKTSFFPATLLSASWKTWHLFDILKTSAVFPVCSSFRLTEVVFPFNSETIMKQTLHKNVKSHVNLACSQRWLCLCGQKVALEDMLAEIKLETKPSCFSKAKKNKLEDKEKEETKFCSSTREKWKKCF